MKKGQIHNLLIVLLISFTLILLGSIFNIFTMTGSISKCADAPLSDLLRCPEGYSLVPNYNAEKCIYKYQCAVINCPDVDVRDCGYRKSPVPIFGWYEGNYCVFDYDCVEKKECGFIPRPPFECAGDTTLTPVFGSDGCVDYYQCGEVFILGYK